MILLKKVIGPLHQPRKPFSRDNRTILLSTDKADEKHLVRPVPPYIALLGAIRGGLYEFMRKEEPAMEQCKMTAIADLSVIIIIESGNPQM